jgi:hypothetical protein
VSQLTLYNAGNRAPPLRGEIVVGLRIGRHDVGPVPSPGGGPETRMLCRGAKRDAGSGDPAYSLPAATKDAPAMRPFPRKQDPTELANRLLTGCNPEPWGPRPSRSHPSASRRRNPLRFLPLHRATKDGAFASVDLLRTLRVPYLGGSEPPPWPCAALLALSIPFSGFMSFGSR